MSGWDRLDEEFSPVVGQLPVYEESLAFLHDGIVTRETRDLDARLALLLDEW